MQITCWAHLLCKLPIKHKKTKRVICHAKEMPRKDRVPYLWDAFNKGKENDSEHSKRLQWNCLFNYPHSSVFVNFVHSFVFLHHILFWFSFSISLLPITLLNYDNMSSPKSHRSFYLASLILKCFSKSLVIRKQREIENLLVAVFYCQIEVVAQNWKPSCGIELRLRQRSWAEGGLTPNLKMCIAGDHL